MTDVDIHRLASIALENFRAFTDRVELDVDADVVIVSGSNGVGKTSLTDALNIALNRTEPPDPRVFPPTPNERSFQDNPEITINGESVVFSIPSNGVKTDPTVKRFATIFYQETPRIDLRDFERRARRETPSWIVDLKASLRNFRDELSMRVAKEEPRGVLTIDEATERIEKARQKVHHALGQLDDDDEIVKLLSGVLLKNGNLAAQGKTALRKNLQQTATIAWSHVLSKATMTVHEIATERRTAEQCERSKVGEDRPIQWPTEIRDEELIDLVFPEEELSNKKQLLTTWREPHPYIVPVNNPELLAQLEGLVEQLNRSAESAEDITSTFTPVARALRPQEERLPPEKAILELHQKLPAWLEALQSAEIEVGPEFQRIIELFKTINKNDLEDESETLAQTIDEKIELKRQSIRAGLDAERRAQKIRTGIQLGKLLSEHSDRLERLKETESRLTFGRLKQTIYAHNAPISSMGESVEKSNSAKAFDVATALDQWAKEEGEAEDAEVQRKRTHTYLAAESAVAPMYAAIDSIISPSKGSVGPLDATPLSQEDFERLTSTANQLMKLSNAIDFWDLKIQLNRGRTKLDKIKITTGSDANNSSLSFDDLSTGQKSIASLALALSLNLLAREYIGHSVIVLDDFGTALDQAQLPALAFIIRALAYSPDDTFKRQFILSSHHGDMTDRLIDLLTPPPSLDTSAPYKLLVHDFESLTPGKGPNITTYEHVAHLDNPTRANEATSRAIFQQLLRQGIEWIEQRY